MQRTRIHEALRDFVRRYERWSVLQRKAVGTPVYAAMLLLNPVLLATLGVVTQAAWPQYFLDFFKDVK